MRTSPTDYAFPIPADYCIVLKAIHEAPSLREAAILLDIDAGALARKVQKIATEFGLLYKIDNKWILSESGVRLVSWVGESLSIQRNLLSLRQACRISSANWLVEKLLLTNHRSLLEKTQNKFQLSYLNTTNSLETEVLSNRTDFAISLQAPYSPEISYKRIFKFDWCLIFPKTINTSAFTGKTPEQIMAFLSLQYAPINVLGFENETHPQTQQGLEVDDHSTLMKAVEMELGWGIVPQLLLADSPATIGSWCMEQQSKQSVNLWWIRSRKDLGHLAELLITCF